MATYKTRSYGQIGSTGRRYNQATKSGMAEAVTKNKMTHEDVMAHTGCCRATSVRWFNDANNNCMPTYRQAANLPTRFLGMISRRNARYATDKTIEV